MCQSRQNHLITSFKPTVSQKVRWSATKEHAIFPPIVRPSAGFLEAIGRDNVVKMVLHHHTLLKKSSIAHLYPEDKETFMEGVSKAAHFIIEALGGGKVYTFSYGAPSMCRTHAPFAIDEAAREVWLQMYLQTLHDINFPKEHIEAFWNWIEPFSLRMITRRTPNVFPRRIFFESFKEEFGIK